MHSLHDTAVWCVEAVVSHGAFVKCVVPFSAANPSLMSMWGTVHGERLGGTSVLSAFTDSPSHGLE